MLHQTYPTIDDVRANRPFVTDREISGFRLIAAESVLPGDRVTLGNPHLSVISAETVTKVTIETFPTTADGWDGKAPFVRIESDDRVIAVCLFGTELYVMPF